MSPILQPVPSAPRIREFFWAGAACLLLALYLGGCQTLLADDLDDSLACSTDSECVLFCPPPGDDPDCDGGPQG